MYTHPPPVTPPVTCIRGPNRNAGVPTYLYLSLASNCGSLLSKLFEMKLITLFVFRVRFREQSVSSIANVNRPQPPPIPSTADAASPMPICVLI